MKAVLALVVIYVGTFLLAIQGASQNSVNAAQQNAGAQDQSSPAANPIDPAKEADIRSLMELTGARDQIQDAVANSSNQYREKLMASVPENDKGQAFVAAFADDYQKKFDVDQLTQQIAAIYDKHYTDDEIKGMLQFYGSPIGQKVASEGPKISREVMAASRVLGTKAAKEALQAVKSENPEMGQFARLGNGQRRWQQGRGQQRNQNQQVAQQPDPQQP